MKKIITTIMIFLCLITTSFGALTDDLVAYYKFDGNTVDETGNGNDGTNYGATSTSSGKIGEAYSFDGVNDYMDTLYNQINNIKTISIWVKTTQNSGLSPILSSRNVPTTTGIGIYLYNSDLRVGEAGDSVQVAKSFLGTNINDGNWHNVVGIFNTQSSGQIDISNFDLYLDGIKLTSYSPIQDRRGDDDYPYPNNNLLIGKLSTSHFNGQIDEIGIWQRELTESEIQDLYNNGNGLQYPFQSMGNNLTIGEANLIIDEVFNNEFSNLNISNNQILYTSFQNGITAKRIYNRYIEVNNKRYAIYYGENPTSSIIQDDTFYTLEMGYTTESDLRNQLQDLIDNS